MGERGFETIEKYRVAIDETWEIFGARLSVATGLSSSAIYKVVTGRSIPNARTQFKIYAWMAEHDSEIRKVLNMQKK
jgi:hypothetical protein